jgi:hypothetical protein
LINSFNIHSHKRDNEIVDEFSGEILIFEIYLSGEKKNHMATNVDVGGGKFTHVQSMEEVLLMPMFTFQVTKVVRTTEKV